MDKISLTILGLILPIVVRFISYQYINWSNGQKNIRSNQFDTVERDKRCRIFSELKDLKKTISKDDALSGLKYRALYQSIGMHYPPGICDKILEYIFYKNISFNDAALNCFLRTPGLIDATDEFDQPHEKRRTRRCLAMVISFVMIAAVVWGVITTLPFYYIDGTIWIKVMFAGFMFLYYIMLIFSLRFVIVVLWEIHMSKRFWCGFKEYLRRN